MYPLLSTYTLPAFNPFLLIAYVYHIISIKHLHALRVELKLLRKLQENRLLQPTGDATATGELITTGELMDIGEAEVQSVQTMRDGSLASQSLASETSVMAGSSLRGIAALFAGRKASSSGL